MVTFGWIPACKPPAPGTSDWSYRKRKIMLPFQPRSWDVEAQPPGSRHSASIWSLWASHLKSINIRTPCKQALSGFPHTISTGWTVKLRHNIHSSSQFMKCFMTDFKTLFIHYLRQSVLESLQATHLVLHQLGLQIPKRQKDKQNIQHWITA